MDEDFEQKKCRTAKANCRIGHDSKKILNWVAFYDEYYENTI